MGRRCVKCYQCGFEIKGTPEVWLALQICGCGRGKGYWFWHRKGSRWRYVLPQAGCR